MLTGVWVIAHECGHRAFSDNEAFGDAVGLVLHSVRIWRNERKKETSAASFYQSSALINWLSLHFIMTGCWLISVVKYISAGLVLLAGCGEMGCGDETAQRRRIW